MNEEQWTLAKVSLRVAEVKALFAENPPPPGTSMTAFSLAIGDLPEQWKGLALQCATTGFEFGADMKQIDKQRFQRESILCGIGLALLLLGVFLAFWHEHYTIQQDMVLCTLTGLGASSFLVFLPGFLSLSGTLTPTDLFETLKFRAGGGAAIFILVFYLLHRSLLH
ncbi:MAG: hypothetical protein ACRYGG_09375 [Janthinobacterium lividum]